MTGLAVDTWYYQRLTFTPWNFLRINVIDGGALFYGSEPWHFYFLQALPMLTLALLPFTIRGCYIILSQPANTRGEAREAIWVAIGTMGIFSFIGHKEWRFVQLLLPIFHCVAAHSLITISRPSPKNEGYPWLPKVKRSVIKMILAVNGPAALYFLLWHQKSQVSIADYVRQLPIGEVRSLGFLMGCHSTPWQSHMHRPELERSNSPSGYGGMLWGITCDPPARYVKGD